MALMAWTEAFSTFVPAGTGWQDYDIFTNKSVPKGAIAAILCTYNSTGTTTTIGVRTNGSALNRYVLMAPYAQSTGVNAVMMYVKVNASDGLIETYASATANVTFYLVGWWTGVDFTEKFDSAMPGSASAWTDVNLNTISGVPAGQVASVLLADKYSSAYTMGVRINGSSVVRSVPIRAQSSGGAQTHSVTMQVKTDASGIVEVYTGSTTNTLVYCLGYFGPEMDYIEDIQTGSIAATGYTDWDITSYITVDGRVADIVSANNRNGAYVYNYGSRINGSALARYFIGDRSDGTGYCFYCMPTGTDASGILELYGSNASYEYFRYLGCYEQKLTQTQVTRNSDARFKVAGNQISKLSDSTFAQADNPSSTVDSDGSDTHLGMACQRHVFFYKNRFWVFYADSAGGKFRTSTDGSSWSGETTWATSEFASALNFTLVLKGQHVHVAWCDGTNQHFHYRRGLVNFDGTITWDTAQQISTSGLGAAPTAACSIEVADAGYPYQEEGGKVYVAMIVGGSYYPYVWCNDNTDGTWVTRSSFPYQLTSTSAFGMTVQLVRRNGNGTGDILALYGYNGATLKGKVWYETTDAWTSEVVLSSHNLQSATATRLWGGFTAQADLAMSETRIYFLASDNNVYHTFMAYNDTWSGSDELVANGSAGTVPTSCGIKENAYDSSHDIYPKFWVILTNLTSGKIEYRTHNYNSGSGVYEFGTLTKIVSGQSNLLGEGRTSASLYDYQGRIPILFALGTGAPYTLKLTWLTYWSETMVSKASDATFQAGGIVKTSNARFKKLGAQVSKTSDSRFRWPTEKRRSHTINSATGTGTNYQVKVKVHYGSGSDSGQDVYLTDCRTDFADIRFRAATGELLDSWCETKTDSSISEWWVEVAADLSSSTQDIYVCWSDNQGAAYPFGDDQTQMDATFIAADHFYGNAVRGSKWGGTAAGTVSASKYRLDLANSSDTLIGTISFAPGYAVRLKYAIPDATMNNANQYLSIGAQYEYNSRFAEVCINKNLGTAYLGRGNKGSAGAYYSYIGASGGGSGTSRSMPDATYYTDEIRVTAAKIKFILENGTTYNEYTDTSTFPYNDTIPLSFACNKQGGTGSAYALIDWVAVRKFVETEPTHGGWGSTRFITTITKPSNATFVSSPSHQITKASDTRFKKLATQLSKTAATKVVKRTQLSKLADNRFKKASTQITKSADDRFKKLANQLTKLADTRLKKAGTQISKTAATHFQPANISKSSNARFKKTGNQLTDLSNARFKKVSTQVTKAADTRFKKLATQLSKLADTRFKKLATQVSKLADTRMKKLGTQATKTADTRLKKTGSQVSKLSNATFQSGLTNHQVSKLSNSRYKRLAQQLSETAATRFKLTGQQLSKLSDARLKKSIQLSRTAAAHFQPANILKLSDSRFKKVGAQASKLSDARFRKATQLTKLSNARLKVGGNQLNRSANARFKGPLQISKLSATKFSASPSISKASNARFLAHGHQDKTSSVRFKATLQTVTHSDARFIALAGRTYTYLHGREGEHHRDGIITDPGDGHGTYGGHGHGRESTGQGHGVQSRIHEKRGLKT